MFECSFCHCQAHGEGLRFIIEFEYSLFRFNLCKSCRDKVMRHRKNKKNGKSIYYKNL